MMSRRLERVSIISTAVFLASLIPAWTHISPGAPHGREGSIALQILAGVYLLFGLRPQQSAAWSFLAGPVLLGCSAALYLNCISCAPITMEGMMPLAMSLLGLWATYLFSWKLPASRLMVTAFGAACFAVPWVQAYLIAIQPRLCPICLTAAVSVQVAFYAALSTALKGELAGFAAPKSLRVALVPLALALMARQSLVLAGIVADKPFVTHALGSLEGQRLTQYAKRLPSTSPPTMYLVTTQGCGACRQASSWLNKEGVEYTELATCSALGSSTCFDLSGHAMVTPTILVTDRAGVIVDQYEGWPGSTAGVQDLIQEIQKTLRRLNHQ